MPPLVTRTAAMAACLLACGVAAADSVLLDDGTTTTGRVAGLSSAGVNLGPGEPLPMARVRRVQLDQPAVPAYPMGLWLTDGTCLGGAVHDLKPDSVALRSVTLGERTFPLEQVSAIYFGPVPAPATLQAPTNGLFRAVLKTGLPRDGHIMVLSGTHVLLRLETGLEKIPIDNVACLVRAIPGAAAPVVLRNGDRLPAAAWTGDQGTLHVAGAEATITLRSVSEISWGKTAP